MNELSPKAERIEAERAFSFTPEKIDGEKWVKVQIYMATHTLTGYVYCPRQQRLLDMLNGIPIRISSDYDGFLLVSDPDIYPPDGKRAMVQSIHINKANILFIKEIGGERKGVGGEVGQKVYPYVAKAFTAVKLYMPSYTLAGQMRLSERTHIQDVLNSQPRFLALTSAELCPSAGKSETGISFVAVNKEQIILLEELEPAKINGGG